MCFVYPHQQSYLHPAPIIYHTSQSDQLLMYHHTLSNLVAVGSLSSVNEKKNQNMKYENTKKKKYIYILLLLCSRDTSHVFLTETLKKLFPNTTHLLEVQQGFCQVDKNIAGLWHKS